MKSPIHNHTSARQTAIAEAQRWLAQGPLFLDTETTGLDGRAEIVEIAIVDHEDNVLIDTLVKPRLPIPAGVSRIHGITNAHVRGAPAWADLWPQIAAILEQRPIGIYNAGFDLRLMAQSHRSARLAWTDDQLRSFCIMQLYARFYGEQRNSQFRWQSLAKAAVQCRLPLANSHRAAADARLARAVLCHMAEHG